MQIRTALAEDYEQMLGLLQQLNPADPAPTDAVYRAFEEILGSESLLLFVAESDGKLLGSCYLNLIPNMSRGGRPYAVIENVITDSAHRQQGIGQTLLSHTLNAAWEAGCYKAMLMSGRKDPGVHTFYRSCGFNADEKQAYIHRAPAGTDGS